MHILLFSIEKVILYFLKLRIVRIYKNIIAVEALGWRRICCGDELRSESVWIWFSMYYHYNKPFPDQCI